MLKVISQAHVHTHMFMNNILEILEPYDILPLLVRII